MPPNLAEPPPLAIRRRTLLLATVAIAACFAIGVAAYVQLAPHHVAHGHHITRSHP